MLFFLFAGNLYAQTSFFAGLGIETNGNTREGAALGGCMTLGLEVDEVFAAGFKATFSSNMDTLTTLEPAVFFRYYLSSLLPLPLGELFAQAETGISLFFEYSEIYPAFYVGLAAGWRVNVWEGLCIEPLIRLGYPTAWGVGVSVSYRIGM